MALIKDDIDFEGQKLSEKLMQIIIISFAIVSFIVGFVMQSVRMSCYIMAAGIVLTALVVLPPWPFYSKNPIKFLPVQKKEDESDSEDEKKKSN